VIDAQNAHVGAPARSALLDRFGRYVENTHEGDRPAGNAGGGQNDIIGRTQARKGKSGSSAGFVDQRGELHGVKDLFHGIAHRQDKAGGQLSQFTPGIHERRGIGQKFQLGHYSVEFFRDRGRILFFIKLPVRGGDGIRHAPEHLNRSLQHLSLFVALQIAPLQNRNGVFCQFRDDRGIGLLFHENELLCV